MKSTTYIAAALIVSLAAAPAAFAWGWGGKRGPGPGYAAVDPGVVLTTDQQKSINGLQQQFQQETAPITAQIRQTQLAMQGLMLDTAIDASAVTELQKELSNLRSQFDGKRVHYQLESRKLLTAEQIAQLPPGCTPGFGSRWCGKNPGKGFGMGPGSGRGYAAGCGMGPGYGRGYAAGFGCGW